MGLCQSKNAADAERKYSDTSPDGSAPKKSGSKRSRRSSKKKSKDADIDANVGRAPTHIVTALAPEAEAKTTRLSAEVADSAVQNIMSAGVHEAAEILTSPRPPVSPTRHAANALGTTRDEVEWDRELCKTDPAAGLATFLTSQRVRTDMFYKILDKERTGQVSDDDFVSALVSLGMPLHPINDKALFDELIAAVNPEGSNGISYLDVSQFRKSQERKARQSRRESEMGAEGGGASSFHGSFRRASSAGASGAAAAPAAPGEKMNKSKLAVDRPTELVRSEQAIKDKELAEAREKHAERQQFLESQNKIKKQPSRKKAKQESFKDRMDKARKSTQIGEKRVHPFLDKDGTGSVGGDSPGTSRRSSARRTTS